MNHFYIYKNNEKVDGIIVALETDGVTAFGDWLEDVGLEEGYEMIETNDDGHFYAEVGTDYYEIREQ